MGVSYSWACSASIDLFCGGRTSDSFFFNGSSIRSGKWQGSLDILGDTFGFELFVSCFGCLLL